MGFGWILPQLQCTPFNYALSPLKLSLTCDRKEQTPTNIDNLSLFFRELNLQLILNIGLAVLPKSVNHWFNFQPMRMSTAFTSCLRTSTHFFSPCDLCVNESVWYILPTVYVADVNISIVQAITAAITENWAPNSREGHFISWLLFFLNKVKPTWII